MRIASIHRLTHSVPAIEEAFARLRPEATLANLPDDSLLADLARDGALTPAMHRRFLALARHAASCGDDGILFTGSTFGPCLGEGAMAVMLTQSQNVPSAGVIVLVPVGSARGAWITPSADGKAIAGRYPHPHQAPQRCSLAMVSEGTFWLCVNSAMAVMDLGDLAGHDAAAARAAASGKPVLTTPDSAVRKPQRLLTRKEAA